MRKYTFQIAVFICLAYSSCNTDAFHKEAWMKPLEDTGGVLPVNTGLPSDDFCAGLRSVPVRAKSVSIVDFGAVGDGATLNTKAFQNAIAYLSSFSDKGGGQLFIPAGKWLTGSFNLTSFFTLFLDDNAIILATQDRTQWPIVNPLPSYGSGRELPGGRHISLIHGENLTDVVITGNNGTIDGQGEMWWQLHFKGKLDFTRGHLLELVHCQNVIISSLTFKDSPFWNIHPVYCSNVLIRNLTILAPIQSPNTDGVDPDSSSYVCIEDCYIANGDDLISIKSGWDEHGINYGVPSFMIAIRHIEGSTRESSGVSLGSEMSGGISNVYINDVIVHHAHTGIRVKSGRGRGGYIRDIHISDLVLHNLKTAIGFTDFYSGHPDNNYDPEALPAVGRIFISNVVGENISSAGEFQALEESPFHDIYLKNITLHTTHGHNAWSCSYVQGYSESVYPEPCPALCQRFS